MILKNKVFAGLMASATVLAASPAYATKTVTSPYVTEGRATVEWRGGYESFEDRDDVWKARHQLSYGFTNFYDLKVSVDGSHVDGDTEATDVDFENKFQITPKGEYFVDLGVRLDYTRSLNGGADGIGTKILFGKQLGEFSNTLNLEAGREVGDNSSDDWEYGLAYGVSHSVGEGLALGAEWYSDFGDFEGDWDQQSHLVGPVFYGTAGSFKYQAGVLAGVSEAAPDALVKATMSYSFDFLK